MEHLFFEGDLPSTYQYNFKGHIFNTNTYRLLQASAGWISFYLLNEKIFRVEAHVHFYCNESAVSIIQAPFGGIEYSNAVTSLELRAFVETFCTKLAGRKLKSISIATPPVGYQSARQPIIDGCLRGLGFEIAKSEITSVVYISEKPFAEVIHPRKKRKLAQTQEQNFEFTRLPGSAVDEVYDFIAKHRSDKGYSLSASPVHLRNSLSALPSSYCLFGVHHQGELVAASIAVRVSDETLYHFISDHIRKIGKGTPALVLMHGIYDFCRVEKIKFLDLGTSMTDRSLNVKLLKFKSEIGGEQTNKLTFVKVLNDE